MTRWWCRRFGLEDSLVTRGLHVMLLVTRMCFYECVLIWLHVMFLVVGMRSHEWVLIWLVYGVMLIVWYDLSMLIG